MKNLKKLIYQYKFLNLELSDIREEHSELTTSFEALFSDIIGKQTPETEEEIISRATKPKPKTKRPPENESVKKLYKDVAKKLHPDKGGDDDDFKELNRRYNDSDYLGLVEMAVENDIEVEVDDDEVLLNSISKIETKIKHLKDTLPYVWKYGSDMDRRKVLLTMSMHLGVDIDLEELPADVKKMIGIKEKLDLPK